MYSVHNCIKDKDYATCYAHGNFKYVNDMLIAGNELGSFKFYIFGKRTSPRVK